jgi:hypothetical protein
MRQYPIRALGLGEILDTGLAITKNHFGLLFGIMVRSLVPFFLIWGLIPVPTGEGEFAGSGDPLTDVIPLLFFLGIYLVVVGPLAYGAATYGISCVYLSQPVTIGRCYRHALGCWGALVGSSLVSTALILPGFLLIVPGVMLYLRYFLVQPVVVVEGAGSLGALSRSGLLIRGNAGTAVALGLLVAAIEFGVNAALEFIPQPHLAIALSALVGGATAVFASACYVVFYFSCRCKHENFDLEILARSVEADSPSNDDGGEPAASTGV